MSATTLAGALGRLGTELIEGASAPPCFVLNDGDLGLLRSLEALSAEAASESAQGGATIAAHVDHLRYGLSLMNRWAGGERDPWSGADWGASWATQGVTETEWADLRASLGAEARSWLRALRRPRDVDELDLTAMLSSLVHLAYHLGAIRQVARASRGPRE